MSLTTIVYLACLIAIARAADIPSTPVSIIKVDSPIMQNRYANDISYFTLEIPSFVSKCDLLTISATPVFGSAGDLIVAVSAAAFPIGTSACPASTPAPTTAVPLPPTIAPTIAPSTPITCASSCRPSASSCDAPADETLAPLTGPFFVTLPNVTVGATYHVAIDTGTQDSSFVISASCSYAFSAPFRMPLPSNVAAEAADAYSDYRMPRPDYMLKRTDVSDSELCLSSVQVDKCTAVLGVFQFDQGVALYTPQVKKRHHRRQADAELQADSQKSSTRGCATSLGSANSIDVLGAVPLSFADDMSRGFVATLPNGCRMTYAPMRMDIPAGWMAMMAVGSIGMTVLFIACSCCVCRCCPCHTGCRTRANRCCPRACPLPADSADAAHSVEFYLPQVDTSVQQTAPPQQPYIPSAVHVAGVAPQYAPHSAQMYPAVGGAYAPMNMPQSY